MQSVTTEVAVEVAVGLEQRDGNAGAGQQVRQHDPTGAAPDDHTGSGLDVLGLLVGCWVGKTGAHGCPPQEHGVGKGRTSTVELGIQYRVQGTPARWTRYSVSLNQGCGAARIPLPPLPRSHPQNPGAAAPS